MMALKVLPLVNYGRTLVLLRDLWRFNLRLCARATAQFASRYIRMMYSRLEDRAKRTVSVMNFWKATIWYLTKRPIMSFRGACICLRTFPSFLFVWLWHSGSNIVEMIQRRAATTTQCWQSVISAGFS